MSGSNGSVSLIGRLVGRAKLALPLVIVVAAVCAFTVVGRASAHTATLRTSHPAWFTKMQHIVKGAYGSGYMQLPSGKEPKSGAKSGKTIWAISCGQVRAACKDDVAGVQAAGKVLGWKVNVVDGQLNPTTTSNYIKEAVAAGAKGIVAQSLDCTGNKTAIQQAVAAHVFVTTSVAADCTPPLLSASMPIAHRGLIPGLGAVATPAAAYLITALKGKARIIELSGTQTASQIAEHQAFKAQMKKCKTCKIDQTISFTAADTPNLPSEVQAALVSHPDANGIYMPYSDLIDAGLGPVITQAHNKNKNFAVGTVQCSGGAFALMQQGYHIGCTSLDSTYQGWWDVDALVRLFGGQSTNKVDAQFGLGYQLIDQHHNFPKNASQTYNMPLNYKGYFKKAWGKK